MLRRNWIELARKLVDTYDMDFSFSAVNAALLQINRAYWGEGVMPTTDYPNPFPISLSSSVLGGSVGTGIGFDQNGQLIEVAPGADQPTAFGIAAADQGLARWDLLVISYLQNGITPIPEPSDPNATIDLNLEDDFRIEVITGTPSATPGYPEKTSNNQVILAGLRVPAGATLGTQVQLDLGPREVAMQRIFENPTIVHETPLGSGTVFTLSKTPLNAASLLMIVNGAILPQSQWMLVGRQIILSTVLAIGQVPDAWYIAINPTTLNPMSAQQESPINAGDNLTFNLSGRVANKSSVLVFLNGRVVQGNQFSITQGPNNDQIVFTSQVAPGQIPYAFYVAIPFGGSIGQGSAANIGNGIGLFAGMVNGVLQLKSIKGDGSTATVTDDGQGNLTVSAIGGGGGSGPAPVYHDVTDAEILAGGFMMPYTPAFPARVVADDLEGTGLRFDPTGAGANPGTDFYIVGNMFMWTGKRYASMVQSGSPIRLTYSS